MNSAVRTQDRLRDRQPERLRGLEIDDQPVFRRLLHGQVGWFGALEDFVDIGSGALNHIVEVRAVAHETARFHILLGPEHPRLADASMRGLIRRTFEPLGAQPGANVVGLIQRTTMLK